MKRQGIQIGRFYCYPDEVQNLHGRVDIHDWKSFITEESFKAELEKQIGYMRDDILRMRDLFLKTMALPDTFLTEVNLQKDKDEEWETGAILREGSNE